MQQKRTLSRPQICHEQDWINNLRCPLVNLIEVDGQIVPLAVWSDRLVRDGMVIQIRSQQLESVLQDRFSVCQVLQPSLDRHFPPWTHKRAMRWVVSS